QIWKSVGLTTLSPIDCAPSFGSSCARAALRETASPRYITSGARNRRVLRDLRCDLILGHPSMTSLRPTCVGASARDARKGPGLMSCMEYRALWAGASVALILDFRDKASSVAPCQCVSYFTHLRAK